MLYEYFHSKPYEDEAADYNRLAFKVTVQLASYFNTKK